MICTPSRRATLSGMFALMLASAGPSAASDRKSAAPINVDQQGVALRGYDPVAYFTDGRPARGDARFHSSHAGATYRFASAASKAAFDSNPSRYVPQYGGFCAYAAAGGYKYDADPRTWSIVDGKLYVNYDASVAQTWSRASARYIREADANWPKVKGTLQR